MQTLGKRRGVLYGEHPPERVLELDVKSPQLKIKKKKGRTTKKKKKAYTLTYTLAAASGDTHFLLKQINKHWHTYPELSSLTVSPRCITLSGMQGGRFASAGAAQRSATGETAMLWGGGFFLFLPPESGGGEIVCVVHLDLFWHTYNYSAHLLQERLNVASKALKKKKKVSGVRKCLSKMMRGNGR